MLIFFDKRFNHLLTCCKIRDIAANTHGISSGRFDRCNRFICSIFGTIVVHHNKCSAFCQLQRNGSSDSPVDVACGNIAIDLSHKSGKAASRSDLHKFLCSVCNQALNCLLPAHGRRNLTYQIILDVCRIFDIICSHIGQIRNGDRLNRYIFECLPEFLSCFC